MGLKTGIWLARLNNLNKRYGRGIAINSENPGILLCGVSKGPTGVDVNGQLDYTEDAGINWTHVTQGFPEITKKNIDTFHIVLQIRILLGLPTNNPFLEAEIEVKHGRCISWLAGNEEGWCLDAVRKSREIDPK